MASHTLCLAHPASSAMRIQTPTSGFQSSMRGNALIDVFRLHRQVRLSFSSHTRCASSHSQLPSECEPAKPEICRRHIFALTLASACIAPLSSAVAQAGAAEEETTRRFFKTPSGVKIEEVITGSGPVAVAMGDVAVINYVLRRANGYFVSSSVDPLSPDNEPVELLLGGGEVIQGLEEVLVGMKPGGKRRALIPPEVGYVQPGLLPQPTEYFRQRALAAHALEPLVFELQLLRIKQAAANTAAEAVAEL